MSEKPLALDSVAYGEGPGWRKNAHLIDALPYVDPLTPEDKRAVEKLIEEEMRRSTKRPADYLKELPPMPESTLPADSLLAVELARIQKGEKMGQIDTTRYQLNPPPQSKRHDVGEWRKALDNAHSQLEHQELRLMNLELQVKYGPNVWRAHNQMIGVAVQGYEQEIADLRQKIEEINRARKLHQVAAAQNMASLEQKWFAAIEKNMEIEAQCRAMEEQVNAKQDAQDTTAKTTQESTDMETG